MVESTSKYDETSRLILHRTSRQDVVKGISVIVKGEGVRVFDQDGNCYIDMEAGGTRPVHAGYGRSELAQAGYEQMCEMAYFTPMGFANAPAMKLAEKLAEITPAESTIIIIAAIRGALKLFRDEVPITG